MTLERAAQRKTAVKTSTRILILGVAVEALLGALMIYLMATIAPGNAEAARRIPIALGGAMGTLGVFFGIWWYQLRKSGT